MRFAGGEAGAGRREAGEGVRGQVGIVGEKQVREGELKQEEEMERNVKGNGRRRRSGCVAV